MFAYGIFKVLYAPHKTFKEVIQKPRYIGPILILLLFVLANLGFGYVLLSKSYLDQTTPPSSELDKWTEDPALWSSNAFITANTYDYINGTYYGNKSIEFSLVGSLAWTQLNISEPLNCSGSEDYKSLSFRVKQINPATNPSNVSLYLLSATPEDIFYQNITGQLNDNDVWNNLTISLGPESEDWVQSGNAEWSNITGVKLDFAWPSDSNITLLIDGLFFHGLYKSGFEIASAFLIGLNNPYSPINVFMQFIIQWVVLGGLLFIIPKIFGVKTVWKPLLVIAGFILITYFIRMIVFTGVYIASPEIRYPLEYLGGVSGEWEDAYAKVLQSMDLSYQIFWYIDKLVLLWIMALGSIALRLMFTLSWTKSFIASTLSSLLYIVLLIFLAPGAVLL